ncbi:MAG: hypothetical protein IMW89_03820 [Ktedonobacteraceae bacterium]|nr:hypothetical protein [Ktedonobacteraceae bacterium]
MGSQFIGDVLGVLCLHTQQYTIHSRIEEAPGRAALPLLEREGDAAALILKTLGIMPRRRVAAVARTPFGDVLTLRVGDALHPLAGAIACRIYVSAASIKR